MRNALLFVLAERPMHGYELITELEAGSSRRWRPSPGSICPALSRMEEQGLLTAEGLNGKKVFSLTAGGREAREAAFDVDGADPDQVERAAALLENVRREPYAILADGPTRDEHAEVTGT